VAEAKWADGTPCTFAYKDRQKQAYPLNFLNSKDIHFKQLHGACDATFHVLHEQGIETEKKSAELSLQKSKINCGKVVFWILVLQKDYKYYCMFSLLEKFVVTRTETTKFIGYNNPERYVHLEYSSKNCSSSLYQLHVENKRVEILKNPDAGNRCLVFLLDS